MPQRLTCVHANRKVFTFPFTATTFSSAEWKYIFLFIGDLNFDFLKVSVINGTSTNAEAYNLYDIFASYVQRNGMSKLQEMVKNHLHIFVFDLLSVLFLRQHIIQHYLGVLHGVELVCLKTYDGDDPVMLKCFASVTASVTKYLDCPQSSIFP